MKKQAKETNEVNEGAGNEVSSVVTPAVEAASGNEATPNAKPDALNEAPSKRMAEIEKANRRLHKFQSAVAEKEADLDVAKGNLKKAIGNRDAAVVDLQKAIEGQRSLPGMEEIVDPPEETAPVGSADNWPISELGSKQLAKLVGDDVVEACKNRGEPIGLSKNTLDKLESAELATIADLETRMREKSFWWETLAKSADAAIVTRVVDSLREFRAKHPQESSQTIVESLAAKNVVAQDP